MRTIELGNYTFCNSDNSTLFMNGMIILSHLPVGLFVELPELTYLNCGVNVLRGFKKVLIEKVNIMALKKFSRSYENDIITVNWP